jgi:hypothetical protein
LPWVVTLGFARAFGGGKVFSFTLNRPPSLRTVDLQHTINRSTNAKFNRMAQVCCQSVRHGPGG